MTDTANEAQGYVGECYFCGEGIMEWEKYGSLFHGWAHTECAMEYDEDMRLRAEEYPEPDLEALAEQGE